MGDTWSGDEGLIYAASRRDRPAGIDAVLIYTGGVQINLGVERNKGLYRRKIIDAEMIRKKKTRYHWEMVSGKGRGVIFLTDHPFERLINDTASDVVDAANKS